MTRLLAVPLVVLALVPFEASIRPLSPPERSELASTVACTPES